MLLKQQSRAGLLDSRLAEFDMEEPLLGINFVLSLRDGIWRQVHYCVMSKFMLCYIRIFYVCMPGISLVCWYFLGWSFGGWSERSWCSSCGGSCWCYHIATPISGYKTYCLDMLTFIYHCKSSVYRLLQAKPPCSFTSEEVNYLTSRIQNGGTEVVEVRRVSWLIDFLAKYFNCLSIF